jgi:hypothetical protein
MQKLCNLLDRGYEVFRTYILIHQTNFYQSLYKRKCSQILRSKSTLIDLVHKILLLFVGSLEAGQINFIHLEHGLHHSLRPGRIRVIEHLAQPLRDDLP